jgi:UDP-2,4-diacetamido-2,4,6-trideoxy-beta-L-altropyranose hydrolase
MNDVIVIRADGNSLIGNGHVMRCLALAQAWRRAGGRAIFVQASTTETITGRLHAEGFETSRIDAEPGGADDARQTVVVAQAHHASWIVGDGYRFDAKWQEQIKSENLKLLIWDDYGHASAYPADVVLNQNASADRQLYAHRGESTRLMLGTRYIALRQEFFTWRDVNRTTAPIGQKVLVTLGGADPDNVTMKVIAALALVPDIDVVIVAGGSNPNLDALREAVSGEDSKLRLVVNPSNLPELMISADVAIAAGGSTSWELAYLGLPALSIVTADNQAAIAAELDRRGVSINLGDHRILNVETIVQSLRNLLGDVCRRKEMRTRGQALVDGHGASRVAAAIGVALRLTILSDADSWLNQYLPELQVVFRANGHHVRWIHDPAELGEGDVAFFLSLSRIVTPEQLVRHAHNIVVHESDLPRGRGWSPLTWQVLEGKQQIPISLIEARESVDSGDIYLQSTIALNGNELVGELRSAQAAATLALCREFVSQYPFVCSEGRAQTGTPSYYGRRRPEDSEFDPDKTLREQFNLLRVADPDRYPAFFELAGRRYEVRITATT